MVRRGWIATVIVIGLTIAMTVLFAGNVVIDGGITTTISGTEYAPSASSQRNHAVKKSRVRLDSQQRHPPHSSLATIQFFDGETSDVNFRPKPYVNLPYPDQLSAVIDEWKDSAVAGDVHVAQALFESLNICRGINYDTDEQFAAALDQIQQTHVIRKSVGGRTWDVPTEPTTEVLADLRETYEFCKGVDRDEVESASKWRKLAADGGNVMAQYSLGQKLVDKPEGRAYLESAWNSGHIDSAGWLAKSLTIGTDEMPSDLIAAYAYKVLYTMLVQADFKSRGTASAAFSRTWMDADVASLAALERELRPHELQLARELAKELYGRNRKCCIWR